MFGIGGWELLVIAVAALVVLGPKGLPGAARAIGKVVSDLRRATGELRQSIELDPDLRDIPKALDEINRPLMSSRPYPRKTVPKDGPPDDVPPPPKRRGRRDLEEGVPLPSPPAEGAPSEPTGDPEAPTNEAPSPNAAPPTDPAAEPPVEVRSSGRGES